MGANNNPYTDPQIIANTGMAGQAQSEIVDGVAVNFTVTSIPLNSITNSQLANMAQATIKGRASGAGTGSPTDLTATQATAILNNVVGDSGSGGIKGLVPAPAVGDAAAGKYLKADGTFAVPPAAGAAGGVLDGTYPNPGLAAGVAGDGLTETSDVLSVNVDGSTIEISGDALRLKDAGTTNAKLANMTEATIKGRAAGAGTGAPVDLTATQVATILGLDAIATKLSNLSAAVAPTVNEDSGDGYAIGSFWLDTTADDAYICLDASVGAALWKKITP
jgi:hypothetical protein